MPLNACLQSLEQVAAIFEALAKLPNKDADQLFIEQRIGKHIRHILDHFDAVLAGLKTGRIDYNQRQRESLAERDRNAAHIRLSVIRDNWPSAVQLRQPVKVISEVAFDHSYSEVFDSSLARECLYLVNHTIHHVAYVKLLLAHAGTVLPANIGIAPATASFERRQCAH